MTEQASELLEIEPAYRLVFSTIGEDALLLIQGETSIRTDLPPAIGDVTVLSRQGGEASYWRVTHRMWFPMEDRIEMEIYVEPMQWPPTS